MAEARKNPFARPLDIGQLISQRPAPLDYVLHGLVAGSVGLLVGPGGVSKTMLMLQLGVAMATGTPLLSGLFTGGAAPGQPPKPAKVVLVLAEESVAIVWHRLYAIANTRFKGCASKEEIREQLTRNLVIHALAGSGGLNLLGKNLEEPRIGDELRGACEGARLVVLDPLSHFHAADENDATSMSTLLRHIAGYAASTNAAWVLVHHTSRAANVNGYGRGAEAGRGSTALTNSVRWQMNLSRPDHDAAKRLGLHTGRLSEYVLLDLSKVNYISLPETLVLRRGSNGILMVDGEGA